MMSDHTFYLIWQSILAVPVGLLIGAVLYRLMNR